MDTFLWLYPHEAEVLFRSLGKRYKGLRDSPRREFELLGPCHHAQKAARGGSINAGGSSQRASARQVRD